MLWPTMNGPQVVRVFTTDTSAAAARRTVSDVKSVVLGLSGSGWVAETVELLSNEPAALMVAVTVMAALAPTPRVAMVHGSATHPPPLTLVMVRFVGVSVTWTFVAVDGPAFATTSV